jgi:hypothetical protein
MGFQVAFNLEIRREGITGLALFADPFPAEALLPFPG